ncbi:MAG: conjugative transfer signal peptidase TraF [Methylobacter sp.]
MNLLLKRVADFSAIAGVIFLLLSAAAYAVGLRVNTTKSIPVGIYMTSSSPVEKDAYVMFCPPQVRIFEDAKERGYIGAGFCPGRYGYMMKRILAAKKDTISVNKDGVRVNDVLLAHSTPLAADSAGRPLPKFKADSYTLDDSELLLMSDISGTSFDGRYFGPINRSQIETVIRPLFTW